MDIIDITGLIFNDMWQHELPVKDFNHIVKKIELGGEVYNIDIFNNLNSISGTHLEGIGKEGNSLLNNVSIEKLADIETYILQISFKDLKVDKGKSCITIKDIKRAEKIEIPKNSAILISTGYGKKWESKDYIENGWYLEKDAAQYLLDKTPFLIGGDSPYWDFNHNDGNIYQLFIRSNILLLYPCINLERIKNFKVKLTVLPLNISDLKLGCTARAAIEDKN